MTKAELVAELVSLADESPGNFDVGYPVLDYGNGGLIIMYENIQLLVPKMESGVLLDLAEEGVTWRYIAFNMKTRHVSVSRNPEDMVEVIEEFLASEHMVN